jgi:hypothetical protein
MQTRWKCPNGCGGVLGPKRPRRDDVRRYCLDCSKATGRLVERFSPVIDKGRERKAQAAREKARKKVQREKEREAAYYTTRVLRTIDGKLQRVEVDLLQELKKMQKLKAFYRYNKPWRGPITLKVRRANHRPTSRLGYAKPWSQEISVTTYPGQTMWEIREILLHEIAHLRQGRADANHHRCHHGPSFKKLFREAGWEYFGDAPGLGFENIYVGAFATLLEERDRGAGSNQWKED